MTTPLPTADSWMQNEDPVCWKVITAIESLLKGYPDLSGLGGVQGILAENIEVWHRATVPRSSQKTVARTPGIIISPSRGVISPPEAGTSSYDYVYLNLSLQIVDRLIDQSDRDKMRSYWKWYHNILAVLHMSNLRGDVDESLGQLNLAWSDKFDPLDERMFAVSQDCVMAIGLTVKVTVFRDARGSV